MKELELLRKVRLGFEDLLDCVLLNDDALAQLESSVAALDSVIPMLPELGEEAHAELQAILLMHQSLVTKLSQELAGISDERKVVRKKLRAVMSYIDVLPERVSTRRGRKG